jgi:hypothetical protein
MLSVEWDIEKRKRFNKKQQRIDVKYSFESARRSHFIAIHFNIQPFFVTPGKRE